MRSLVASVLSKSLRTIQHENRKRHPDVAIKELGFTGPRRRVVMNAGTLNLWPVSFGGAVIQSHQHSVVISKDSFHYDLKQNGGNDFTFSCQGTDKTVKGFIALTNTSGPQPGSNGSSALGKDDTCDQQSKSPSGPLMQNTGEGDHPCRPLVGKNKIRSHLGSPYQMCRSLKHIGKVEPFLLQYSFLNSIKAA